MSRLVIGIMGSKAPQILERTLPHWDGHDVSILVHVDAKFDIESFRFVERHPYARLIWSRQNILWGGFNMVVAEMTMMREAVAAGPFDWFLTLSDDSVPLMPAQAMIERLEEPARWVELRPTDHHGVLWRYQNFFCNDVRASNPQAGVDRAFAADDFKVLSDLRFMIDRGKEPLEQIYWTSQWKGLRYADILVVLDEFSRNTWLTESFRFSYVPDEHYIPTVVAHSGSKHHVGNYIWTDFTRIPSPFIFEDLDELAPAFEQGYLFTRKVHDPEVADRIMAREAVSAETVAA